MALSSAWAFLGRLLVLAWMVLQAATFAHAQPTTTVDGERRFTLLAHDNPRIVFAGADLRVPIRLRNDGVDAWSDAALYRVSYWWLDADGQALAGLEASRRTFLPRAIAHGEVLEVEGTLRTPRTVGVYRLRWDVVREGVGWFHATDPTPAPATTVIVVPSFATLLLFVPIVVVVVVLASDGLRRVSRPPLSPEGGRSPGTRRDVWGLVAVGVLSVCVALWIRGDRTKPTVFGDEALYTYKARNFATHGSYFAPPDRPDSLHLSAPLYSALLAPIVAVIPDPDDAFPWILLLNALLHASMIYPAWKIAEAEFPERRWLIVVAIAFWTVPAGYSLSIMSEALFVPLFLWTGYSYQRAVARPGWATFTVVGVATGLLLLTRFSGVAMLGVLGWVCAVSREGGRFRLARGHRLLERVPMMAIPALCWAGLRWTRAQHEPEALHSLYDFAAKGVLTFDGHDGVVDLARVWMGELAYLNLATFNLLALLSVAVVVAIAGAPAREATLETPGRTGLLPLRWFFFLACGAMLVAATAYMYTRIQTGKPRYLMYGRYADMVVPVVVIYGLGLVTPRLRPRWSWRWCLGVLAGVAMTLALFGSIPDVGDTRIINMGAAWYQQLQQAHAMTWWMIAIPCASLSLALVVAAGWPARGVLLVLLLVAINVHNTRHVERSHRFYAAEDASLWRQLAEVETAGGRVLYQHLKLYPQLSSRAQYLLYDRVVRFSEAQDVDPGRDVFVTRNGLMPAHDPGVTTAVGASALKRAPPDAATRRDDVRSPCSDTLDPCPEQDGEAALAGG